MFLDQHMEKYFPLQTVFHCVGCEESSVPELAGLLRDHRKWQLSMDSIGPPCAHRSGITPGQPCQAEATCPGCGHWPGMGVGMGRSVAAGPGGRSVSVAGAGRAAQAVPAGVQAFPSESLGKQKVSFT